MCGSISPQKTKNDSESTTAWDPGRKDGVYDIQPETGAMKARLASLGRV